MKYDVVIGALQDTIAARYNLVGVSYYPSGEINRSNRQYSIRDFGSRLYGYDGSDIFTITTSNFKDKKIHFVCHIPKATGFLDCYTTAPNICFLIFYSVIIEPVQAGYGIVARTVSETYEKLIPQSSVSGNIESIFGTEDIDIDLTVNASVNTTGLDVELTTQIYWRIYGYNDDKNTPTSNVYANTINFNPWIIKIKKMEIID